MLDEDLIEISSDQLFVVISNDQDSEFYTSFPLAFLYGLEVLFVCLFTILQTQLFPFDSSYTQDYELTSVLMASMVGDRGGQADDSSGLVTAAADMWVSKQQPS